MSSTEAKDMKKDEMNCMIDEVIVDGYSLEVCMKPKRNCSIAGVLVGGAILGTGIALISQGMNPSPLVSSYQGIICGTGILIAGASLNGLKNYVVLKKHFSKKEQNQEVFAKHK